MIRAVIGVVWLLLALGSFSVSAHQQKEAITRVLFNPRTGNIEVMHRFLVHDAEHAMQALFGETANLLASVPDQERFASYVLARFSLLDQDAAPLPLTPVGHELDGKHLWVYAETPVPEHLTGLTITHSALRDIWQDQTNLVNVERDGEVRSAIFAGGSREITIEF